MVEAAVALVDEMALLTVERSVFTDDDMLNFCLDLRQLLTSGEHQESVEEVPVEEPSPEPELVGV